MSETPDHSSHAMTWREFKELVDAKLKELGRDDEMGINLIEVSSPHVSGYKSDEITVEVDEFGLYVGDDWANHERHKR